MRVGVIFTTGYTSTHGIPVLVSVIHLVPERLSARAIIPVHALATAEPDMEYLALRKLFTAVCRDR